MKIKYNSDIIKYMSIFSTITKAELKDCFIDNNNMLTFVVNENNIGRAIGKRGIYINMLEKALNRKIKIVEFNPNINQFVKNVVFPLKIAKITQDEKKLIIEAVDSKTRGKLISRAAKSLRNYESIVKRYFDIDEIKVL